MNSIDPSGLAAGGLLFNIHGGNDSLDFSRGSWGSKSHASMNDDIGDAEASHLQGMIDAVEAARDARYLNAAIDLGVLTADEAAAIAANNPMLAVVENNPVLNAVKSDPIQPCSISVEPLGVGTTQSGVGEVVGMGFNVTVDVSKKGGGIYYENQKGRKSKGNWTVEQWVADFNTVNGQIVRFDKEARKDDISAANPKVNGNTGKYFDSPGTRAADIQGKFYSTTRDFYIKAYRGKEYCDVTFHLGFSVSNRGRLLDSNFGSGKH